MLADDEEEKTPAKEAPTASAPAKRKLEKRGDYLKFGKEVGEQLAEGRPKLQLAFFTACFEEYAKAAKSKDIKEVLDQLTKSYNLKIEEERKQDKEKKKKGKGAKLAGGGSKAINVEMNNKMTDELFDDEGGEDGEAFERPTDDFDFM